MVVCPHCQHNSADPLFCDRCNGLLPSAIIARLPAQAPMRDGRLLDCSAWQGVWPADCWRPLHVVSDGRPYRVYGLGPGWWRELSAGVQARAALDLDVLAPLEVIPIEDGAVVAAAALPGAVQPLLAAAQGDELARLDAVLDACRTLAAALAPLHRAGLVWLSFAPEALESSAGRIQLTNLDLQFFRAGACPDSLRLSAAYSPPEVCGFRGDRIGPATDVFHASLYLYYRLAGLLPGGFPGRGLEAFDFDIPPLRIYCPNLPPGIAPVLERGLARDPSQRYATTLELVDALTEAVARARRRCTADAAVGWECGSATVIGRSHELQGLPNQDSHIILSATGDRQAPRWWLAVVADGVTHARVGSGEVASQAAVEVLACRLPLVLAEARTEGPLDAMLTEAFLEASRAILDLALLVTPAGECDPVDLMSSTVVVGALTGNVLTLANAGDSRAYLIADGRAEQLTVDGDVRCTQLAGGAAPEEVRDMGPEASALYTCLGVSESSDGGVLTVSVPRCTPHISRWRLLPGDIVVLCSDGLVEEGVFLEPAELPRLLEEPAGQSAAAMASQLVAAARSRHRDPSAWEPGGCGDDVTCVVLVVGPAAREGEPGHVG